MGTPEFAVPSLTVLIERKENLVGVVTQPDRPVGRGQNLKASPVKQCAAAHGVPIFQPQKVKRPDFVEQLRQLAPDVAVVVAYGQIFSRELLDIPPRGFINVHSSLLPAYRGAAPINWALINGEKRTGVTIMRLDEGMDTGAIIIQEETPVRADDNAQRLHDRLAELGAGLLAKTLDMLQTGSWDPAPQDHSRATYAPLLKKQDGLIAWTKTAAAIVNQIRGMTPWPGCFTYLGKRLLKIHLAVVLEKEVHVPPGTILTAAESGIEVAAAGGSVLVKELQLEGKKRMAAADFLKGTRLAPGAHLGETD